MSSPPQKYLRYFDFTQYATTNPEKPLPGASVDQEYNRLKATTDQTIDRLNLIQRDDGSLNAVIGTAQLVDGSVTTPKLADGAVTNPKIADAAVGPTKIAPLAVVHSHIGVAAVNGLNIDIDSINTAKIVDLAITTPKLADGAVTSAKLAPGAVTPAAIPDGSISSAKIQDGGIATVDLADLSVTTPKLADAAVTSAKLAASLALTGVPTAPTPATGTNTTQLATTAFVAASMSAAGSITEAPNDGALYGRQALGWQLGVKLSGDTMTGPLVVPSVKLGGITNAFPMLKPNGAALDVRLADDSAYAPLTSGPFTAAGYAIPAVNNSFDLGAVALRWKKLWAVDGDFSGNVGVGGNLAVTGNITGNLPGVPNANKVINGDMRIDQRNGGAAVNITNTNVYTADRWSALCSGLSTQTLTAQAIAAFISGVTKSMRILVGGAGAAPVAGGYACVGQKIEGLNCYGLLWGSGQAKPVTVSFKARTNLAGNYGISCRNAANDRSYVASFAMLANTDTTISITIPGCPDGVWDSSLSPGMMFYFDFGVGATYNAPAANAWQNGNYFGLGGGTKLIGTTGAAFEFSNFKVEDGAVATPFVSDDMQVSLAKCQRYYWKDITAKYYPLVLDGANAEMPGAWCFNPVQMRTTPAMLGVAVGAFYYNTGAAQASATPVGGTGSTSGNNQSQIFRYTWATGQGAAQVQKSGQWLLQLAADAEL